MSQHPTFVIQQGTTAAPDTVYIQVTANGPYKVYGKPPLQQVFITNVNGNLNLTPLGPNSAI